MILFPGICGINLKRRDLIDIIEDIVSIAERSEWKLVREKKFSRSFHGGVSSYCKGELIFLEWYKMFDTEKV